MSVSGYVLTRPLAIEADTSHVGWGSRVLVVSPVDYTPLRPFVIRVNDTGGSVESLLPKPPREGGEGDAMVGGDA